MGNREEYAAGGVGTGRVQDAHSKRWSVMDEDARAERVARAQEAEKKRTEGAEAERQERIRRAEEAERQEQEEVEKTEERKNTWFNTAEKYGTIEYRKEGAFNSEADPMADAFGPGSISNPREIEQFRGECKKYGVAIIERENESLNYQPNPRIGQPGQLCVSKGASYGAWLHEMQHMRDDRDGGWNGARSLWDIEEHIAWEKRAYGLEIDLAEKLGRNDIANLLRANLEAEIKRLYGSE